MYRSSRALYLYGEPVADSDPYIQLVAGHLVAAGLNNSQIDQVLQQGLSALNSDERTLDGFKATAAFARDELLPLIEAAGADGAAARQASELILRDTAIITGDLPAEYIDGLSDEECQAAEDRAQELEEQFERWEDTLPPPAEEPGEHLRKDNDEEEQEMAVDPHKAIDLRNRMAEVEKMPPGAERDLVYSDLLAEYETVYGTAPAGASTPMEDIVHGPEED